MFGQPPPGMGPYEPSNAASIRPPPLPPTPAGESPPIPGRENIAGTPSLPPIAAIRPDEVNLPLLLHVLGAMVLVGGLFAAVTLLLASRAVGGETANMLTRLAFRTLLIGVLPAYIVMRVGAQWVESEENIPEEPELAWIGIGYIVADLGAILTIITLIVGVAPAKLVPVGAVLPHHLRGTVQLEAIAGMVVPVGNARDIGSQHVIGTGGCRAQQRCQQQAGDGK